MFDYGWADAFERAGGHYYPKLQASVPFTPATGRRLLTEPGKGAAKRRTLLAAGGAELTRRLNVSSLHITFLPEDEWLLCDEIGYLRRTDQQFHWQNDGFSCFDDFLACLASRKRKQLKRERRDALSSEIAIEWITGSDLAEHHWDAFYAFYMDTGSRKWGSPYLNRQFFSLIGERMADRIVLIMAKRAGRYIAGALNFFGSETIFGRHWGCSEHHPFLHFELCYYQAIDFAIAHRLKRVEAGAQGAHKLARGYEPVQTHSAHYIANPNFRDAVANFLNQERLQVAYENEALRDHLPFRHADKTS